MILFRRSSQNLSHTLNTHTIMTKILLHHCRLHHPYARALQIELFFNHTTLPQFKFQSSNKRQFSFRSGKRLKSSSRQNPSPATPVPEFESPISSSNEDENRPEPVSPSGSNSSNKFSLFFDGFSGQFKIDQLGSEILAIAIPAALALAADPITSLVDTAFVGHLGSAELAAVGVSISVFNLVAKLLNIPLLNITTSFVAEEQALLASGADESSLSGQDIIARHQNKKFLPSVSTSLALAAVIGVAETIVLSLGSGFLMNTMGIPVDSPMRIPAEQYTALRAFGAPPIVIALAAQGTFRGFKDTKTPLYAIVAGNLLNAILDPILMFIFGLGIGGAAIATVISEYLIAFILLWKLNSKVALVSPNIDGKRIARYLKSGGLLISRSLAVLLTMTLATSMAVREGPIPMAGHQICLQVWLALSLLNDALALAGQALLASDYSKKNYGQAREVIYRVLQIGLFAGVSLSGILFFGFGPLSFLFSTDSEVLNIARSGTLFVAASQPINAFAFVIDGLYYGVSDFGYAAYSMILIGLVTSAFFLLAVPKFGLAGVWTGLFLFMALRVVAGILRFGTKSGPWKLVWSEVDQKNR